MKRLFLLSLIIISLFYSCKTLDITRIPKKVELTGIDFTKYTKSGFLITPEKYSGTYESIGLIDFIYMPSAEYKCNAFIEGYNWKENPKSATEYSWVIEPIKIQDALDEIYNRCLQMGANALINFKASVEEEQHLMVKNPVVLKGYRITGFAIKIK